MSKRNFLDHLASFLLWYNKYDVLIHILLTALVLIYPVIAVLYVFYVVFVVVYLVLYVFLVL